MIVDASALLAVLLSETDASRFADAIAHADAPRIPAPNWLEGAMRLETMSVSADTAYEVAEVELRRYTANQWLAVMPFTGERAALARQAFRRFGKGRHPAGLNFGDCIAYAVAKLENLPLLFKGNDFFKTDIEPALKY